MNSYSVYIAGSLVFFPTKAGKKEQMQEKEKKKQEKKRDHLVPDRQ